MPTREQITGALGNSTYRGLPPVPPERRREKLRIFRRELYRRREEFYTAAAGDLWRKPEETFAAELFPVLDSLDYLIKKLPVLVRPRKVAGSFLTFPGKAYAVPEPFGRVLVISHWSFPVLLALEPVLGAYAAGNRVILKFSRRSPRAAHLTAGLLEEVFSSDEIMPVSGEAALEELLRYPYDFIFSAAGKAAADAVLRNSANFHTPAVIFSSASNPAVVAPGTDLKVAARRIVWSKFLNAGQNPLAPNFIFIHRDLKDDFLYCLRVAIREFSGDNPLQDYTIAAFPDRQAYTRACQLISQGRLIVGGDRDPVRFAIEPTVIDQLPEDSPLLTGENFAPVLPILTFSSDPDLLKKLHPFRQALALYCFGGSRELRNELEKNFPAGAVVFNDALIQFVNGALRCGGIGRSGMGYFRENGSFNTFTHWKTVVKRPFFPDLPFRYLPACRWFYKLLEFMMK